MDLNRFQQQLSQRGGAGKQALPPVDQWDPPFCGDMDMVIKADGRWFYQNSPIGRLPLVRLFSTVLKREGEAYFLVTPVEKVGIQVEDVPFLITQWREEQGGLLLTTQTGDEFAVGPDHPVELRSPPAQLTGSDSSPIPYVLVRTNLWARLHQNVYYQLLEQATPTAIDEHTVALQLTSLDYTFSLGQLPAELT